MWNTVFPKWSLVGDSKCYEMEPSGRFRVLWGVLQEAVILRWKDKIDDVSISLSQVGSHQIESHSMCFVRSETIYSGWIRNWNNVWPLERTNRIRIYESGEKVNPVGVQNRETTRKAKETSAKYVCHYILSPITQWRTDSCDLFRGDPLSLQGHRGSHKNSILFHFIFT